MATYTEIRDLFNNSELRNRIEVATVVYAEALTSGTPTAAQKSWISSVLSQPRGEAEKITLAVLASNRSYTPAQILSASDSALQAKVDAIAPLLIDAMAGA